MCPDTGFPLLTTNVEEQLFKESKTVVEQPEPKGLRNLTDSLN